MKKKVKAVLLIKLAGVMTEYLIERCVLNCALDGVHNVSVCASTFEHFVTVRFNEQMNQYKIIFSARYHRIADTIRVKCKALAFKFVRNCRPKHTYCQQVSVRCFFYFSR